MENKLSVLVFLVCLTVAVHSAPQFNQGGAPPNKFQGQFIRPGAQNIPQPPTQTPSNQFQFKPLTPFNQVQSKTQTPSNQLQSNTQTPSNQFQFKPLTPFNQVQSKTQTPKPQVSQFGQNQNQNRFQGQFIRPGTAAAAPANQFAQARSSFNQPQAAAAPQQPQKQSRFLVVDEKFHQDPNLEYNFE